VQSHNKSIARPYFFGAGHREIRFLRSTHLRYLWHHRRSPWKLVHPSIFDIRDSTHSVINQKSVQRVHLFRYVGTMLTVPRVFLGIKLKDPNSANSSSPVPGLSLSSNEVEFRRSNECIRVHLATHHFEHHGENPSRAKAFRVKWWTWTLKRFSTSPKKVSHGKRSLVTKKSRKTIAS
jgi:hypothetical protein